MRYRKGMHYGPQEGSVADRLLGMIEAGVTSRPALAAATGLKPYQVRHNLRHHVRTGYLEFNDETYQPRGAGA